MFDVAVAIKAINGLLEIIGGYFLIFKPGGLDKVAIWAVSILDDINSIGCVRENVAGRSTPANRPGPLRLPRQ